MRIALIADTYPPSRSSGAVQLRDLAEEFVRQGFDITVIVPSSELRQPWTLEANSSIEILRLDACSTKDVGYVRRAMSEMMMPIAMLLGILKSPHRKSKWDAIVWYSPSIFLGPLIMYLKRGKRCRSYLILRDIFPEWAVDVGILQRGLAYRFFKIVEKYQYDAADVIGVQSPSNLCYLAEWARNPKRRLEVLENWLSASPDRGSSISVAAGLLSGRKIFVYVGNMGVAQGMDFVLDLAERFANRQDIGFLFVGRGAEIPRLRDSAQMRKLTNVVFYDEIDSSEIPGLLAQCHIGLVTLDPRHKTHNVPGKFLSYMQAGLPVLARVNEGNDLVDVISANGVGRVYVGDSLDTFQDLAERMCEEHAGRKAMSVNARRLAKMFFSTSRAARQITAALFDEQKLRMQNDEGSKAEHESASL